MQGGDVTASGRAGQATRRCDESRSDRDAASVPHWHRRRISAWWLTILPRSPWTPPLAQQSCCASCAWVGARLEKERAQLAAACIWTCGTRAQAQVSPRAWDASNAAYVPCALRCLRTLVWDLLVATPDFGRAQGARPWRGCPPSGARQACRARLPVERALCELL